jgi:hypothetical protein
MSETPRLFLIGSVMVAFAVVLAWLSSPARMELKWDGAEPAQVERTEASPPAGNRTATISVGSRLFGLIDFGQGRIEGVRGATMVDSRAPGSRSNTPPHMVFETKGGAVNLGRPQQLFASDFSEIKSFFESQAGPPLTLSSIAPSSELRRFLFAQAAVLFLGFGGLGILWIGTKRLWS